MASLLQKFLSIGQDPSDNQEERVRKSALMVMSGLALMSTTIWGIMFLLKGWIIPGLVPISYNVIWIFGLLHFIRTRNYIPLRNMVLSLYIILPITTQIVFGGFIPSGAIILFSMLAPTGALVFHSTRKALVWFGVYLCGVLLVYSIDDRLPEYFDWNISGGTAVALLVSNIVGISVIVFGVQYFFVGKITELNADIESKNLELEKQSKKLKEMDEVKSRFFANISHEFRTPLTLILGLLNKYSDQLTGAEESRDFDIMKRNGNRLLLLINQLLDLSKLESGELKLQSSPSDIVLFSKNITAQFESMAADKEITFTFNNENIHAISAHDPIELYFDQEKLHKVLANLLSNAVKFTHQKGKIAVSVKQDSSADMVVIKVSNTGEGIPSKKLPFVFNRFFQVNDASNREYEGTGIGLALVKELVELHKGSVDVESDLGVTTFCLQLPLDDSYLKEDEKVEAPPPASLAAERHGDIAVSSPSREVLTDIPVHAEDGEKLQVLVVEDNHDLRTFVKNILETQYAVHEAFDGVDGLEKAEELIPDLIISDVMMPRMDGYDLCRHLKASQKTNHIPLIMLTAKATRENKLDGLETGADDYLVKPFDEEELMVRIRNLILIREQLQKKFQGESWQKPAAVQVTSVHQRFLEDLKKVIEENLDNENFGVEDLGQALAMSRSQVHRKLKAITDQSTTTFIRNYRLHRAADLLKQDAGNVTEIAYQVGFNSQTYFSSSFHELFGCSPSEFKNISRVEE